MPAPILNRPTPLPGRAPTRLPRAETTRAARVGEVLRGLAAALVLLAVVGGVPLALLAFVGNPLPTTAPSRGWLDAQLTAAALLDVLAVLLWLLWGHFVVCVLVEVRTWARGGAGGRVPAGGANQVLARRLVAAVLLLAAGAGSVPAAAGPHAEPVVATSSAAPADPGSEAGAARPAATSAVERSAAPDASWAATATTGTSPTTGAPPSGTPRSATATTGTATTGTAPATPAGLVGYVVQPPQGRHHDCLWDIAERTLGDPLRYREIYELNEHRVQPDGSRLVDVDLIRPGWTLLLPADATSGTAVLPFAPDAAAPAAPTPTIPAPDPTPLAPTTLAPAPAWSPTAGAAQAEDPRGQGALGAGLAAFGLFTATRRSTATRRPRDPGNPAPAEGDLRAADRAPFLDVALRRLAAAADAAGTLPPDLLAARVGTDHLHLHLAGPAAGFPAPAGFTTDGRSWSVERRALEAVPATGTGEVDPAAPYPALAALARLGEEDLLVDLEAAPGLVALTGDPGTARALALSIAAGLALDPWSHGVHVHLVGFAVAHPHLARHRVEDVRSLPDLLPRLEAAAAEHRNARALGAIRPRPHVVVLSGPPSPADAARLDALVAPGRTPFAVLVVGNETTARWRFHCTGEGSVDLGVLGVTGRVFARTGQEHAQLARGAGSTPDTVGGCPQPNG